MRSKLGKIMMMKGLGIDESMSNLTSTLSGETSISSNARNESSSTTTNNNNNTMLYPQASFSSFASPNDNQAQPQPPHQPLPAKKKRNLPDPDAEVIALSPKSLLATNRFICEICNKGFQRDQNLQLHRRGHNLPWKLKQRAKNEVIRRKVYVCPEPSCIHHDPSRALGDLTGIKKHFCRKHGEKKWKCEKCTKKYAVQSDWKAHSKICGTREYRCDCGTLFSRRDSFITHRAFCDALAEEGATAINPLSTAAAAAAEGTSGASAFSHLTLPPQLTSHHQLLHNFSLKREVQEHHVTNNNHMEHTIRPDIPPWLACPPPPQPLQSEELDSGIGHPNAQVDHHQAQLFSAFQAQYEQSQNQSQSHQSHQHSTTLNARPTLLSFQAQASSHHPQMSATALLQKATEIGVTASHQYQNHNHHDQQQQEHHQQGHNNNNTNNNNNMQMSAGLSSSHEGGGEQYHQQHQTILNSTSVGLTSNTGFISEGGQQSSMLHDSMLMSSMQSTLASSGFDSASFGDFHPQTMNATKSQLDGGGSGGAAGGNGGGGSGNEGMTRDFLGLTFSHKDFLNMAGFGQMSSPSSASFDQQQEHQNQTPW